jgi:hypothetical protein
VPHPTLIHRGVSSRIPRAAVSLIACAALVFQTTVAPVLAQTLTRAEYEACQARDEASFRSAIETLTQRALQTGLKKVDYAGAVSDEWRKANFDDVLDKRVDAIVADVTTETSLWERSRSLFNQEKAKELATSVAERVYRSDEVKTGLETITAGVARGVGSSILLATSDAAEPSLECLKAFLGPRYGSTVARVVADDAKREFQIDPAKAGANIGAGSVLAEGGGGLAGAVILVVRRQLANIASRIGQRIVGSILGRLVSVVAGGIGVVLIAKDIWEFRNGVLPIVATEMKAKATKDLVKAELSKAISEQINEHTREIASTTADRVIEIWREFRRGHAKVIELVERNAQFRAFVDTLKPGDLARLDEVVALLLSGEGEAGVVRRLGDGSLVHAVTKLPAVGMEIARELASLEKGLQWSALAVDALPFVTELGLHKRLSPADVTGAQLRRLIALDDRTATTRLAGIPRSARDTLMELPDRELKALARALGEPELQSLSSYLTGLEPQARDRVMKSIAAAPPRMQALAPSRVREAILASRDQLAAVSMMLSSDQGLDVKVFKDDLLLVYDGRVSPILLVDKHPAGLGGIVVGLLMLLLVARRLVFGRRGKVVAAKAV